MAYFPVLSLLSFTLVRYPQPFSRQFDFYFFFSHTIHYHKLQQKSKYVKVNLFIIGHFRSRKNERLFVLKSGIYMTVTVYSWFPGAPLTYFNDGGSEGFFWVWHFGQKGFFWVNERRLDFFGLQKQHRDFFGYCIFNQLKSTISR